MSDEVDDEVGSDVEEDSAVVPSATALAALALGAVLGALTMWVALPANEIEVTVPRDLTPAELEAACDAIVPLGSHTGQSWPDQDFYPITGRKIG